MNEIVSIDELERIIRWETNVPKRKCVRHLISEVCPQCVKHFDERFCLHKGLLRCYDDASVISRMEKPLNLDEWLDSL